MAKLRILEVASEVAPFARTGGLGDVLGSLPKALSKLGHEIKVVMPRYGSMSRPADHPNAEPLEFPVIAAGQRRVCTIETLRDQRAKIDYYFTANPQYFARPEFYLDPETGRDFVDNDERFMFLCKAALELIKRLDWRPDIIHVHDWQTALVPAYLRTVYAGDEFFAGIRTVLTIHNLGYQGLFPKERFPLLGLPERMFYAVTGPFEFFEKVNFLKGGIMTADWVTTVSERYAREIQAGDEFGCGLDGVLRERSPRLTGILNGVDYTVWSPSRDKLIPYHYALANLSGKRKNKVELMRSAGLPMRDSAPLIGIISRLTNQKGLDLVADAAERLFAMNIQMIVLGNGDVTYHELFRKLEQQYPDKLKTYLKFDDSLAHLIEAGADVFLMPSRWEPCGLNQMYSLKYGTVPIVREVGGLADTVVDYDPATGAGTGILFQEYTAEAMLEAIDRAVTAFRHKRSWMKLMKAGMEQDFSWDASARKYVDLFSKVMTV